MLLDSEPSGPLNPRPNGSALSRSWIELASIAALVSASTSVLLLCPCDRPAASLYSLFLASLSGLFALGAAGLVYVRLRRDKAATAFISAFEALAIAAVGVYAEMRAAFYVIQWLALHRH